MTIDSEAEKSRREHARHLDGLITAGMAAGKRREAAANFRTIAKHLRSKSPDAREADRYARYLDELAGRYDAVGE